MLVLISNANIIKSEGRTQSCCRCCFAVLTIVFAANGKIDGIASSCGVYFVNPEPAKPKNFYYMAFRHKIL
jgi:hypothetical protein